jgi:LemA protein
MRNNYNSYIYGSWIKWGAIALALLILVIGSVSTYNGLITAEQDVRMQWSEVENQMQRRADVITNQVEVVKGYVKHEEKVFSDIANARAVLYDNYSDMDTKIAADQQMADSGRRILALAESYPELKADKLFANLQTDIEGSENRVARARGEFIGKVQIYNTKLSRFPGNLFAKMLGFEKIDYFKASTDAQQTPKVNFGE